MPTSPLRQLAAALALACSITPTFAQDWSAPVPDTELLKPATVQFSSQYGFAHVFIDGQIHAPTVQAFESAISRSGAGFGIVFLNSRGGDLNAAMELGRTIRAYGFATQVGRMGEERVVQRGICDSACPVAFAGGAFRLLDQGTGELRVHRFFRAKPGRFAEDSRLLAEGERKLRAYFTDMGIDSEYIGMILSTPETELRIVPKQSAEAWRISTGRDRVSWESAAGSFTATMETPTDRTRLAVRCEGGAPRLTVDLSTWYPPEAILNYETHSLLVDNRKHPLEEVSAALGEPGPRRPIRLESTLSESMAAALGKAESIGYSMEHSHNEFRREARIRSADGYLSTLLAGCKGS